MRHEKRPPLSALATRQHGVVSVRQLQWLGYSRSAIVRAAAAGRLHRVHRGVYAVGHLSLCWEAHQLAAVLACGPGALLSHTSEAALWGLLSRGSAQIHVTAPTRRHAKATVRVHHGALSADDRARQSQIPVTALARTLLDVAAMGPLSRLEGCIERAEVLRLLDLSAIDSLLGRVKGHRGRRLLRGALAGYRPEAAFTRSELERRFLDLIRGAGLPLPSMNFFAGGYELDAYWSRERFAVELDGYAHHRSGAAFERDRRRQEDLKLAGIEMIRVTARRLADEPDLLAARISTLLQRRRRELEARLGA